MEQRSGAAPERAEAASEFLSFHDLYEQLERADAPHAPDALRAVLDARLPRLQACGAPLPKRSAAAREALARDSVDVRGTTLRVSGVQRELALAIAARFDVEERESLALLRTFLESEHRSLDALPGGDGAFDEFLDAFTVFFFEEQLAVIRCIAALLRISEDAQNALYATAVAVLDRFADAAFATQLLAWFEEETQCALPPAVRHDPRYTQLWARQGLCKQLALLEVVFLLYYGRLPPTAAFQHATLAAIQRTQFGQRQANAGFLDTRGALLVESVAHLLVFLAVECLSLEAALEPLAPGVRADEDAALAPLAADPDALDAVLELLDSAAGSLVYYAPLLLGWALLLRRADEHMEAAPDARLAAALAVRDGGAPMWRRMAHGALEPSMDLFGVLHALLASPLLGGRDSAVLGASDLSALAYRAVFKGLLLALTELVHPEYLPDLDALVALYAAAFGAARDGLAPDAAEGVASLCLQFWSADMPHPTRASTLATARRRFPAALRPLVQLAHALSGNAAPDAGAAPPPGAAAAEASAATLDYLAQLPTLALVLPPGAAGLAPYEVLDTPGAPGVQYVVRRALPVACTRLALAPGTRGTLISPLGSTPSVVLWQLPAPVSAWRILRDVLARYVAPAPRAPRRAADEDVWAGAEAAALAPDALSPDCAPGDWDAAADIAQCLGAVLGADAGLGAALLAHLDEDEEGTPLAAIAVEMLRAALPAHPIPTRLVCAAYRLLALLVPLQPNEVWQRVRASNALIGSPGTVPLRAAPAALHGAHGGAFSRLLDAEVRTAHYAGTLALLDLACALLDEAHDAAYADAPELQAVKCEVLVRLVEWVADAVWPEHQHWPYAAPRDALEIARRCVRLVTRLVAAPARPAPLAPLDALADALFGPACAPARLRPLAAALAGGRAAAAAHERAGRPHDARLAEELVEAHLHLAAALLARAPHAAPPALAALFYAPAAADARTPADAPVRPTLARAVLGYVAAPVPPRVARAAAELTTAVCTAAPAPRDARASFASALGATHELERAVHELLGVLDNTRADLDVRVAVWRLLGALADTQPALAALLFTGAPRGGRDADARARAPALQLAVDAVADGAALWTHAPALLDAALQFLGVACAHADEHAAALRALDADARLLDGLGALVARDAEPVPPTPASDARVSAAAPGALADAEAAVAAYAHRVQAQARALRLLQRATQRGAAESARVLQQALDAPRLPHALRTAFATDLAAPHALEAHAAALVPHVPLAPLRKPPRRDAFDTRRTFGGAYVYARDAYVAYLAFLPADVRHDAAVLVTSASLAWSIVDAQAARADAWTECLASCAARFDARGAYVDAAHAVLAQAAAAPRDAPPAALAPRVRVAAVLLAAAWAARTPAALDETAHALAALVEHPAYAPEWSALTAPLAELALVACAAARRAAPPAALAPLAVHTLHLLHAVVARAAVVAPDSADAAEADAVLPVLAAAVQHALHVAPLAAACAAPLRDTRVLAACAALVSRAPRAPSADAWAPAHVRYLAALLPLCAALAAQRATCERLAESGLVYALCSNALSDELAQGALAAALPSGDANPRHALWLGMLQTLTSLVETLAAAHAAAGAHLVAGDAEAFVHLYAPQLRRTLHVVLPAPTAPAAPPLDAAQLLEFRAVLRLLYAMSRAKPRAAPRPLGAELAARLPYVLQELGYLYTHPRELATLLGVAAPDAPPDGEGAAEVLPAASAALRDAVATLLALLWDVAAVPVVLLADAAEWPPLPALITPSLHSEPAHAASLGTLLAIASTLGDAARALPASSPTRPMLATALAQCIALTATQAVLWARGTLPPAAPDACRALTGQAETEIASGLGRDVDAAIRVARAVCAPGDAPLLDALHRFSQQYLGAPRAA